MLTPQGMRQRFLLGRYARQKYTEEYDLLDPDFAADQIYCQSTDSMRTIQSCYTELMGLYPPDEAEPWLLSFGEELSLRTGRGLPGFSVQDATGINMVLDVQPLPNGFVSVPVTTFIEAEPEDDIAYQGCPFVD